MNIDDIRHYEIPINLTESVTLSIKSEYVEKVFLTRRDGYILDEIEVDKEGESKLEFLNGVLIHCGIINDWDYEVKLQCIVYCRGIPTLTCHYAQNTTIHTDLPKYIEDIGNNKQLVYDTVIKEIYVTVDGVPLMNIWSPNKRKRN